jgi:octaprenyl-diphosphate synthase
MDTLQKAAPQTTDIRVPATLPIAEELEEVECILSAALRSRRHHVSRLVSHLRHYRGKRLRPILLLLSARASGTISPAHHILAAVVEMIHTATLVHDDVLDNASIRRHKATVNAGWGNESSVLLGDFLFTHAFHLASTVDARACRLIGEATNRVCEGELQQIAERGNLSLTEEQYLDIIDGKTAELTSCCCRLGSIYSGAADTVVDCTARYGRYLGMSFQIADDLLDLVGEEEKTGKSLGTDVEQQKLTLPLIHLLQNTKGDLNSRLRQILSSLGNHKREVLRPFLAQSDALAYANRRAEEYASLARAELTCLPASPSRDILEALTEQVIHRNC